MRRALTLTVLAALLVACGANNATSDPLAIASSTTSTPEAVEPSTTEAPEETPTTEPTTTTAPFDAAGYAAAIEAEFIAGMGDRTWTEICGGTFDKWHCFFDRIEAHSPSQIIVHLSYPGDVTAEERADFAHRARTHIFNFVGPAFPELDTIISYDDGRDSGYTRRADTLAG